MKPNLLDVLRERPLLGDGAMGTQLMLAGLAAGAGGMLGNVEHKSEVEDIHRRYATAGCDLATANTFEGSRIALAKHGLGDRVEELNREGVARARVVARDGWVLGDVGSLGEFLAPLGDLTEQQAFEAFKEQATALAEAKADAIIVETITDSQEMVVAIRAAKTTGLPVIASYAFDRGDGVNFRTMMGVDVPTGLKTALDAGADVVGANCGASMGLDDYRKLADSVLTAAGKTPAIMQPNAGAPRLEGAKTVYDATPEQMADLARDLLAMGCKIVGGCCGTTPDHLAAMRRAFN